jgi:hypothetical protein
MKSIDALNFYKNYYADFDMQKALDLLPYEIHADDPLYQEKYAGMQIDKLTGVDKLFNEHLTQDEKSLYQYLLDTQGKEKAADEHARPRKNVIIQ